VNILITARAIYVAIKDDPKIVDDIKCEYKELAKGILLDESMSSHITSASVNGQSFSKTTNITKTQRLAMLSAVVTMITNGYATSSKVTPYF